MAWPITRIGIRDLIRTILQDTSVNVDQQDIENAGTSGSRTGLNDEIDRALREVCVALDVRSVPAQQEYSLSLDQSIYELTLHGGAWDVEDVRVGPTGVAAPQDLAQDLILDRKSYADARALIGDAFSRTTEHGDPQFYWIEAKDAWATTEQFLKIGIFPPLGDNPGPPNTRFLKVRARVPPTAFISDLTILSLPPPADRAIAELVSSWILDWRGDHADSLKAEHRYDRAMQVLQSSYGVSEKQAPEHPVDVFEIFGPLGSIR